MKRWLNSTVVHSTSPCTRWVTSMARYCKPPQLFEQLGKQRELYAHVNDCRLPWKGWSPVSCSVCFCSSGNMPQRLFSSLASERHLQSIFKYQGYWPRAEWLWRLIGRCSLLVLWPNLAPKLPLQAAVLCLQWAVGEEVSVGSSSRVLAMSFCLCFWVGCFSLHVNDLPPHSFRTAQGILFIGL